MISSFSFLRIYQDIAHERISKSDDSILTHLFEDLKEHVPAEGLVNDEHINIRKYFDIENPDRLDKIVAIDSVAHAFHGPENGQKNLNLVFPEASYQLVKSVLDDLAGMENTNEVRRVNRGFFSTLLSDDNLLILEKQLAVAEAPNQVGRTTREDIADAIDEYKRLFVAKIASPAEILTLHRYDPGNDEYRQAVLDNGFDKEENLPMVVGGPASVEMIDKQGHLITTEALASAFEKFMENFRGRNGMIIHSDVQVGWILPAYITENGIVFKSGVDDKGLWAITEVRNDSRIADKVKKEIEDKNIKSYSIAGSALKIANMQKGAQNFVQVNELEISEITLCERGVNQGAAFNILKSEDIQNQLTTDKVPVTQEIPEVIAENKSSLDEVFACLSNIHYLFENPLVVIEEPVDEIDEPVVVITASERNSLTDAIEVYLKKFLPPQIKIEVRENHFNSIPLLHLELEPHKFMHEDEEEEEFFEAPDNDDPYYDTLPNEERVVTGTATNNKLAIAFSPGAEEEKELDEEDDYLDELVADDNDEEPTIMDEEKISDLFRLQNWISEYLEKQQPPRQGLVPKSGDWLAPDRWIRPLYHGSSVFTPVDELREINTSAIISTTFGPISVVRHGIFLTDKPKFAQKYGEIVRELELKNTSLVNFSEDLKQDFIDSLSPFEERDLWLAAKYAKQPWMFFDNELGERFVKFLKQNGYNSISFPDSLQTSDGDEVEGMTFVTFDRTNLRDISK